MRQRKKDEIKGKIRETKVMEKQRNLQGECLRIGLRHTNGLTLWTSEQLNRLLPPSALQYDFSRPPAYANFSHLPSPSMLATQQPQGFNSQVGFQTPIHDSSSWHGPPSSAAAPAAPFNAPVAESAVYTTSSTLPNSIAHQSSHERPARKEQSSTKDRKKSGEQSKRADKPLSAYLKGTRGLDPREKTLLYHFVDNVLRLIFPVLDIHEQGPVRSRDILYSLETNKSYYHCCLSVSAIHLKSKTGESTDETERDIMQHRYRAVSHLCQSLNSDQGHDTILDATLAMIFFHCSVGAPDDHLPDIPWNEHFTAVTNLVNKLGLIESRPFCSPPFNISLTAWIDILGGTMLGKSPYFAHTYRNKHLNGVSSGLRELMGCDDRIMYLISEIACLDSLRADGQIDDFAVCHHISALSTQLEHAQPSEINLENPASASGLVDPEILTRNMTAVFRVAAEIYLYSLVPSFDRHQPRITNLVASVTEILKFIPTGPYGFDRSLVWPLLITGWVSTPSSPFREILTQRAAALGDTRDFGSFGRMYHVLQEIWRLSDLPTELSCVDPRLSSSAALHYDSQTGLTSQGVNATGQAMKRQAVHWRVVMQRNGWRYLLI